MGMNLDFEFFNTCFKGQEVRDGETEFVSKKNVLKKILDDDHLNKSFKLVNPFNNTHYIHFYAKEPWKGLYLFEVVNTTNRSSLFVLFDTRTPEKFVLVEKNHENPDETLEVAMVIEYSLMLAAQKYGWETSLVVNKLNMIQHVPEFISAMRYIDNIEHSYCCTNLTLNQTQVSQQVFIENNFHGDIDTFNNYQNQ